MLLFQLRHVKAGLLHINGKISSLFVHTAVSSPIDVVSVLCPCRVAASWAARRPMLPRQGLHPFCRAGDGLQEVAPVVLVRSCAHPLPQLCASETSVAHGQDGCRRHSKTGAGGESSRDAKCFSQKPGLSCALQHLEKLIEFTGTSAPRVLGAKTQKFRVRFQRHSSHLETQIRGRCLKKLWS